MTLAIFYAAVVALTIGENYHGVAAWNLSYAISPQGRSGEYISLFSLGNGLQGIVGPLLVSLVLMSAVTVGWVAVGLIFMLGLASCIMVGRHLEAAAKEADVGEERV